MYEQLLEPLRFYKTLGKAQHSQNVSAHFEALKEASGIDEAENRATVKKYRHELDMVANINKQISKQKIFRVLLIIASLLIITLPLTLFLIFKKINPKIKNAELLRAQHETTAAELLALAESQMAPLNALFRDDDALRLIEKTIPEIDFTERFTPRLKVFMNKGVSRQYLDNENTSVLASLQGEFTQNPFVFLRRLVHQLGTEIYHGSLVISWSERYTDSQGNRRTRTRTQTLHASLEKPKPYYHNETFLCYANQAAPDLCFSRSASDVEELNEKQIERRVKKGKKKLEERAREALEKGDNFREMSNAEFDVLFGATDRNHEVQFRVLFTPLAQRNMTALLKGGENLYGDDFSFVKRKELNVIRSEHAQTFPFYPSAKNYYSYDIDLAKSNFENFNKDYFKAIFFDFAPLISIPAYLDEPTGFLEEKEDKHAPNYANFEHEKRANELGASNFAHKKTKTSIILKTSCIGSTPLYDDVEVVAYSYTTADRLDFVSVIGGDGRAHPVPVHWIEYIPLENTRIMRMSNDGTANIL